MNRDEIEAMLADGRQAEPIRDEADARAIAAGWSYLHESTPDGGVTVWPDEQQLCGMSAPTHAEAKAAAQQRFSTYLRYYPAQAAKPILPTDISPETILAVRGSQLGAEKDAE